VWKRPLGIVVPPTVPGVARHRVELPSVLLDVLAVIGLVAGQSEGTLLQDGVAPVPQGQRQPQSLLGVAQSGQSIFTPAVRAGPSVIVWQIGPGAAVSAVVLSDCAPLPFAEIRAPQIPVAGLTQPEVEAPTPSIRSRSAPRVTAMSIAATNHYDRSARRLGNSCTHQTQMQAVEAARPDFPG
jgi:hypothetical protein